LDTTILKLDGASLIQGNTIVKSDQHGKSQCMAKMCLILETSSASSKTANNSNIDIVIAFKETTFDFEHSK